MEQLPQLKKCPKCNTEKTYDQFNRSRKTKSLSCWCKECVNKSSRARYERTKDKRKLTQRDWYENNRESHIERRSQWHRENPERYRETYLQRKYGISSIQYQSMYDSQNGLCAICGRPEISKILMAVDHDHRTGRVRALLCTKCNKGLGHFDDDKEQLLKAAEYLEKFSDKTGSAIPAK